MRHTKELLGKCKDFEAETAKETAANHFTYAELEEKDVDLKKLQSWLEKIRKLDFYGATLAAEAQQRLQACEALLDAYAHSGCSRLTTKTASPRKPP